MTPDDIDVWVGLDVGKSAHHAHALDHDGNTLYDKPLKQDEKAIRTMLGKLSKHGRVLLVVDQPNTIGSLPLTVARNMGIAVAYLPGTAMRRTAQLLPGDAKTDRRDAHVIAWAALKLPETLRDAGPDDETLAALKLLAGHDEDLAHESTRHVNRLRSLLLQTHPAFERALKGERITRDATLALLERYGGPMGVKRAGIEDVKDWAKSNELRAGHIIDDMFKAIGEQTVTVPGAVKRLQIRPHAGATIPVHNRFMRGQRVHVRGFPDAEGAGMRVQQLPVFRRREVVEFALLRQLVRKLGRVHDTADDAVNRLLIVHRRLHGQRSPDLEPGEQTGNQMRMVRHPLDAGVGEHHVEVSRQIIQLRRHIAQLEINVRIGFTCRLDHVWRTVDAAISRISPL